MSLFDEDEFYDPVPWPAEKDPCPVCGCSMAEHTKEDNQRCADAFLGDHLAMSKILNARKKP